MTSTAAAAPAKTYNLSGTVSDVTVKMDAKNRPFASFSLNRANGKTVKCLVFAEHIEKVKETVMAAQGGSLRLFGRFDKRSYEVEGKTRTSMRFVALWAGLPKAKSAEQGEQAAAA